MSNRFAQIMELSEKLIPPLVQLDRRVHRRDGRRKGRALRSC